MFQTAPGVTIPYPAKISERYQIHEGRAISANVSYEKLEGFVSSFYKLLPEPLFFVLQLPLLLDKEKELNFEETGLHQEVLYLDGQTQDQINSIMALYGELLLSDGMSQFAIASHQSNDEIFVQKYKLISIYSQSPEKYKPLLAKYDVQETNQLITVWDTFSAEHPGHCCKLSLDNLDAFDVADILKSQGMYHAKIIED